MAVRAAGRLGASLLRQALAASSASSSSSRGAGSAPPPTPGSDAASAAAGALASLLQAVAGASLSLHLDHANALATAAKSGEGGESGEAARLAARAAVAEHEAAREEVRSLRERGGRVAQSSSSLLFIPGFILIRLDLLLLFPSSPLRLGPPRSARAGHCRRPRLLLLLLIVGKVLPLVGRLVRPSPRGACRGALPINPPPPPTPLQWRRPYSPIRLMTSSLPHPPSNSPLLSPSAVFRL